MQHGRRQVADKLDQGGFTLIELVIVIVALGIVATVALPKFGTLFSSSKVTATREELNSLKGAIIGNPAVVAGGEYIDRGFEGDVGFLPAQLRDLARRPDSLSAYNRLSRLGWNGPYVDSSGGEYLKDAWGVNYVYQPASRRIISIGGSDSIIVTF